MKKYTENEILQYVPLDHLNPTQGAITLFARDIYMQGNEHAELLFFFNGGPGFSCIRDWRSSAWILEALEKYRVILLDQRGTGRSQPVDIAMLDKFASPEDLLGYLIHFRADNIVRDTEFLRQHVFKRNKISILGQSFGGFVALSYLSFFPESLNQVFITAGIAPLTCSSVTEVYQALIKNLALRNEKYYQHYPQDKLKIQAITEILRKNPITIGNEILTLGRFLNLGWYLGTEGGFETLHHFFDEAFCDESMTKLSWRFVKNMLQATSFWEVDPLYAVLHESIYCNGFGSHWATDQIIQSIESFSLENTPPYFSGEMVQKNAFKDYLGLQPFANVAELLANKNDWCHLYDLQKLQNNPVPIAVLLIKDDIYVNYDLSQAALKHIKNARVWQHDTWQHDALRKHGKEVMQKLFTLIAS
ncbi:MAG: alpha/beta fold hydrolase [Pseudomonadota bacterium]